MSVKSLPVAAIALCAAVVPVHAQAASGGDNPSLSVVHTMWQMMANYVAKSAEQMPEAKYSYRPTPEVRTFGEIIGHVAGAEKMFCALGMGETPPSEDAVEKTSPSKAQLIAALKDAATYCDKAYSQSDASSHMPATIFGQKQTRLHALVLNATHVGEHYGNLITYLRLNGMVPPSSQGGM
jgi:uncharacterized damage-inducible protein DinB